MTIDDLKREGLLIFGSLNIRGRLVFEAGARIYGGVELIDTKIGAYSYLNSYAKLNNVQIGRYCSIGEEVLIGLVRHSIDWVTTSPLPYDKNVGYPPLWQSFQPTHTFNKFPDLVTIEDDVWIGTRAMIIANKPLLIGRGSVIAAGAIVTKNVEPYSIVGGNPARHIRYRFSDSLIQRFQASHWWEYDFYQYIDDNQSNPLSWGEPTLFLDWLSNQDLSLLQKYKFPNVFKAINNA